MNRVNEVEEAIAERVSLQVARLAELAHILSVDKITPALALLKLYGAGVMTISDISRILGVSVTAGSATVWGWHDNGIVHAERPARKSSGDQRTVVVKLMPATRMKIKRFFAREKELDHIILEE